MGKSSPEIVIIPMSSFWFGGVNIILWMEGVSKQEGEQSKSFWEKTKKGNNKIKNFIGETL